MRLTTGVSSGSGARVDNLWVPVNVGEPWVVGAARATDFAAQAAPRRLASINRKLTASRYGVFTNTVKFYTFRQLGRRLVRIIHPDRSEFASA